MGTLYPGEHVIIHFLTDNTEWAAASVVYRYMGNNAIENYNEAVDISQVWILVEDIAYECEPTFPLELP
jgi:hypothetical protein